MTETGTPADCAYYRGVGTCSGFFSCGYHGEPGCITDEPTGGWETTQLSPEMRALTDAITEICYEFDPGGYMEEEWFKLKAEELLEIFNTVKEKDA